jgi:tRNA pseudouridine38-40 synthase
MRTLLLTLAYDGSAYCGWQWQPNGESVQQVVEGALSEFIGEKVRITAAGRTDAGVHAVGQLVSFHTASEIPIEGFRWGLVTKLPADIVVRDVVERPYGFSARFDAVQKRYRYVIHTSRTAWPWLRNYVWWHRGALDDAAMQAAADVLVGTHDFRCFESQWPNKATSVRTVFEARWWRCGEWDVWHDHTNETHGVQPVGFFSDSQPSTLNLQPFLCFDIVADGFLYNMVRAIVGTLVHVGRGRWTANDMRRILETGDRSHAGDTAPAQGLYLIDVETQVDLSRIAARLERWRRRAK